MKRTTPLLLLSFALLGCPMQADVVPNALFSDNAVIQQKMPVPVWGTAAAGEKVTVEFAGQKIETVATNGAWSVTLKPLTASTNPKAMTIRGSNTVTINNLLIGEVWICSGQSNMELQMRKLLEGFTPNAVKMNTEVASADYPMIRHFLVKKAIATNPISTLYGTWDVCSPKTVTNFTAVGYFFARDLYKDLGVPIGLIHASWGGTPAEAWTRHDVLATNPVLAPLVDEKAKEDSYRRFLAKYKADEPRLMASYSNACSAALAAGKPAPKPPKAPEPSNAHNKQNIPSALFNGMISPMIPYAMRGVIWYQGEANGSRAAQYQTLFPAMIADWRAQWREGVFPFLFVQIAPFRQMSPEIREAQLLTLKKSPDTAMAVITDHGEEFNIHPKEKEPVGARLALAARALAYGQKLEYSGPLYEGAKVDGSAMTITFTHVGKGLVAQGGEPLKGFMIAGADKVFIPAEATIIGKTVVVSSPKVAVPEAVRFGFTNVPVVNLFNKEGLPASPFRTDTW